MTAYNMFAGELDGELMLCHLSTTARSIRISVSQMFPRNYHDPVGSGWSEAKKKGWRVVPVIVEKRSEWLKRR